jgi:cytoskeletal protein RodZ
MKGSTVLGILVVGVVLYVWLKWQPLVQSAETQTIYSPFTPSDPTSSATAASNLASTSTDTVSSDSTSNASTSSTVDDGAPGSASWVQQELADWSADQASFTPGKRPDMGADESTATTGIYQARPEANEEESIAILMDEYGLSYSAAQQQYQINLTPQPDGGIGFFPTLVNSLIGWL